MRHKAKRLTVFNHKGGIGKTTLTLNIAAALASQGKQVLLVDSDPQCNLTSLLFSDDVVNDLLDNSDTDRGRTLWSSLRPVVEGTGKAKTVSPYETGVRRVHLLPGDIKLSNFELVLNELWLECFSRRIRGINGTNALSSLVNESAHHLDVDYVFYDTGPNIGPLNRIILLDCDYFIVPAACDLFSVRALNTMGQTLANWIRDWETVVGLAPDGAYLMPGRPRFLGYIPQRFKTYGQNLVSMHAHYLSQLEKHLYSDIILVLKKLDPSVSVSRIASTKLGEVQDFGMNVQHAQQQGVPLWKVKGGNDALTREAERVFNGIAEKIISKAK